MTKSPFTLTECCNPQVILITIIERAQDQEGKDQIKEKRKVLGILEPAQRLYFVTLSNKSCRETEDTLFICSFFMKRMIRWNISSQVQPFGESGKQPAAATLRMATFIGATKYSNFECFISIIIWSYREDCCAKLGRGCFLRLLGGWTALLLWRSKPLVMHCFL